MTRTMTGPFAASLLAVAVMAALAGSAVGPPSATDKVTINGWALNMSNIATGANQTIRINIDRWSSPRSAST